MPTYADYGGRVISIIAGWSAVSADIHTDADHGMLVVDEIKQAEKPKGYDAFENAWRAMIQKFENAIQLRGGFGFLVSGSGCAVARQQGK